MSSMLELQGDLKSTSMPEELCQILSICPISKQMTVVEIKYFSPQNTVGVPCAESEETNLPQIPCVCSLYGKQNTL